MLVTLGLLAGLTGVIYPGARNPRLLKTAVPGFPSPELQPDPAADMAKFRTEQLQQLNGVWWVDRVVGTVHQPIGDAMRRLAASGIADWPAGPAMANATPSPRPPR